MRCFSSLFQNTNGSIVTTIALIAAPLMLVAGVGADYAIMRNVQAQLQESADAAALASARELGIVTTSNDVVKNTAELYARNNLVMTGLVDGSEENLKTNIALSEDRKDVTVALAYTWTPLFLHYINDQALPIRVSATASLAGSESICVIVLDGVDDYSLEMSGASTITANGCAIYSNSSSASGISIVNSAKMKSSNTYTAGGYEGSLDGYLPRPVTDSPTIDDPLIARAEPSVGSCDHTDVKYTASQTLNPGVYCGGISIKGNAIINLKPGNYTIKDGPLIVSGNSTLKGTNVGFYFTGDTAIFDFGVSTQVNLTAPKSGKLAGILFFEDRSSIEKREFTIRSKDAERFEGTVYLPKGKLVMDKASRVGQLSDWTAIVANQIEIKTGPNLEINSDYANSTIPVPEGLGPSGATARLSN